MLPNLLKFSAITGLLFALTCNSPPAIAKVRRGNLQNGGEIVLSCFYDAKAKVATVGWTLIPRPDRPPQSTYFIVRALRVGESRLIRTRQTSGRYRFFVSQKPAFASIEGQALGTITIGGTAFLYIYEIPKPFGTSCS